MVLKGDGKSPRTIGNYRESLGLLSSFLAGGYPFLTKVSAEHLREWLNDLRSRGNKPSTVNTRYRAANAFFKWLISEGERQDNPLERIEPPHVPETVQPYTPARTYNRSSKRSMAGDSGAWTQRAGRLMAKSTIT